jgi:polar amino acid transport system substrate-binding protein
MRLVGDNSHLRIALRQAIRPIEMATPRDWFPRDPAKSLAAMRTGECDAALHDAAMVSELRRAERWQKFSATLPQRDPSRLTIAANKEKAGVAAALASVAGKWREAGQWKLWNETWAADIDFEVYLEQDAPDCHQ